MKTKTVYFIMILSLFTVFSCSGSDNDDASDELLGSRDFTFNTTIDPATLTQEDSFTIYTPVIEIVADPESYSIEDNHDLEVFNGTHAADQDEYMSLSDLDTYTYFFIRGPGCPGYFDYSHHSYSNNQLTISLDHFRESNIECPAQYVQTYLVFKARKSS